VEALDRGPYLPVHAPFREADDGWRGHLDWAPDGWTPYAHQAAAFARLSTKHGPAEAAVLTTGTGSARTEAFLIPVLDHCRHAAAAGQPGVKALLLSSMSALAADETARLDAFLADPALAGVTAGLYLADTPAESYRHVMTDRAAIRRDPPDILITNVKMLDQLLQRPEDVPLWQANSLAYVVLDEFHTYAGAQGADVAMLLRRLGAVTGAARPGLPLGLVCPVATSTTLGSGALGEDTTTAVRMVAEQFFGTPFEADAVISEDRLTPGEVLAEEPELPVIELSAIEILRRQYVAHLVDLAARDLLPGARPLPRLAGALFGLDGWLADFTTAALKIGAAEVEAFLALFGVVDDEPGSAEDDERAWAGFTGGDGHRISAAAAAEVRAYAVGGLRDAVDAAVDAWERRIAGLRERLDAIDQARGGLPPSDEEQLRDHPSLTAQRRAIARLAGDLTGRPAHGTLVGLGLLPDYALVDAPESELAARFLDGLRAWAARADTPGTLSPGAPGGAAELRISGPDRGITRWRMRLRHTSAGTRPGVHFARLDGPPAQIAVHLDSAHASAEHNRLADDAGKRSRLRADGVRVFQLTWPDVDEWRTRAPGARPPARPPYEGPAQQQAHYYYVTVTGRPADDLDRLVWVNPVDQLLAFLADPDPEVWRVRAQATLGGLLRTPAVTLTRTGGAAVAAAVAASLRGAALPAPTDGKVHVIQARDTAGCPVTLVIDDRRGLQARVFSALAVVDDRPETLASDAALDAAAPGHAAPDGVGDALDGTAPPTPHQRRWAAWLAWTNIIQFLADGDGDAVQLTVTGLDSFDPTLLAAAGGLGAAQAARALADET
jgi:hypothetical protein